MLFKKTKILLVLFIVFYLIILLLFKPYTWPAIQNYGLIVLLVITYFVIYSLYIKKKFQKILDILAKHCDPVEYAKNLKAVIDEQKIMKKPTLFMFSQLCLSTAFMEAGKYDEAYELLNQEYTFCNDENGKNEKVFYFNNLISCSIYKGDLVNAKMYLNKMQEEIALLNASDKRTKSNKSQLITKTHLLNMEQGDYENAESVFLNMYQNAENNYERVCAKFILGRIYMYFNDQAKAKEAFEYVINNGNKLYKVTQAKEYVKNLNNQQI